MEQSPGALSAEEEGLEEQLGWGLTLVLQTPEEAPTAPPSPWLGLAGLLFGAMCVADTVHLDRNQAAGLLPLIGSGRFRFQWGPLGCWPCASSPSPRTPRPSPAHVRGVLCVKIRGVEPFPAASVLRGDKTRGAGLRTETPRQAGAQAH